MDLFLLQIESGLALAAIYALFSISLTVTYQVTGVVQLAQGAIMMCGVFSGYFAAQHCPNPILVALISALVSGAIGFVAYLGAFRWVLSSGHLPALVVGIALALGIEELLRISFFNGNSMQFPALMWTGSLSTTALDWLIICSAIAATIAFELLLHRTSMGRQLRATAENGESAQLLGISTEGMRALSFALGAGLAGVAGVLMSVVYQSIAYNNGTKLEFTAIACILLGGLGSVRGAFVGAGVVGLSQTLVGTYVSSSYTDAVVFGIVLAAIVMLPNGLFGVERSIRA